LVLQFKQPKPCEIVISGGLELNFGVSSKVKILFSLDFRDFLRKFVVTGWIVLKLELDLDSFLPVFFVAGASGVNVSAAGIGLVSPSCYLTVICKGIFKAAASL
jgi:hypothetical protein